MSSFFITVQVYVFIGFLVCKFQSKFADSRQVARAGKKNESFLKSKNGKTIKVIMKLKLNYSSKIVICGNQKIIINFT